MLAYSLLGTTPDVDPLLLLLIALAVDGYVGDMGIVFRFVRHPVVVIGSAVAWFDGRLNRPERSAMDRRIRGGVTVLIIAAVAAVAGSLVAFLGQKYPFGWVLEIVLTVSLLSQRELYDHVGAVERGLKSGGLDGGRAAVAHIVGRDPLRLDQPGVCRAAIESAAENFSDGVVAPVFWYVLFGFPGLLVYKAVNTMDSMIGHRTERHGDFGMVAARVDDLLNLLPARLSGLFIATAALFAPAARPGAALRIMVRDASRHRSPNAGWPEGAMAGALGLKLAGPRHYARQTVEDAWIGEGTADATRRDIRRALHLYALACLVDAAVVAALLVAW